MSKLRQVGKQSKIVKILSTQFLNGPQDKSKGKILQNFMAFSEYMIFKCQNHKANFCGLLRKSWFMRCLGRILLDFCLNHQERIKCTKAKEQLRAYCQIIHTLCWHGMIKVAEFQRAFSKCSHPQKRCDITSLNFFTLGLKVQNSYLRNFLRIPKT